MQSEKEIQKVTKDELLKRSNFLFKKLKMLIRNASSGMLVENSIEHELIKSEMLENTTDQIVSKILDYQGNVYENIFEFMQDLKLKELSQMRHKNKLRERQPNAVNQSVIPKVAPSSQAEAQRVSSLLKNQKASVETTSSSQVTPKDATNGLTNRQQAAANPHNQETFRSVKYSY
jgi:hypothetical protein